MSYVYATQNEKTLSGALVLVMHLLFLLLLVFGVSWQQKQGSPAVIVDLWNKLPALPHKTEPPPVAKAPPEPPKPAPKVEPKPVVKPEPKPEIKPDIALKEKLEKERKLKAEQDRLKAEKKKLEAKKREQEKARAALKEKQAKEAEAKRLEQVKADELRKANELQAAQAAARGKEIDKYMGLIRDKIRRYIVQPPNLQGNPEVEVSVVVLPGGGVLSVKPVKSSASKAYDSAVERAILQAQPLPLPPDPSLFNDFRELNLKIRPKE